MHIITSILQGTLQTKIQTNIKPRNILDRGSMSTCQYDATSSTGKAAAIAPAIHTYNHSDLGAEDGLTAGLYPPAVPPREMLWRRPGRLDSSDAMHPIHTPTAAPPAANNNSDDDNFLQT